MKRPILCLPIVYLYVCVFVQRHRALSRSELWRTTGTCMILPPWTFVLEILLWYISKLASVVLFYLRCCTSATLGRSSLSDNYRLFAISSQCEFAGSGILMRYFLIKFFMALPGSNATPTVYPVYTTLSLVCSRHLLCAWRVIQPTNQFAIYPLTVITNVAAWQ